MSRQPWTKNPRRIDNDATTRLLSHSRVLRVTAPRIWLGPSVTRASMNGAAPAWCAVKYPGTAWVGTKKGTGGEDQMRKARGILSFIVGLALMLQIGSTVVSADDRGQRGDKGKDKKEQVSTRSNESSASAKAAAEAKAKAEADAKAKAEADAKAKAAAEASAKAKAEAAAQADAKAKADA